MPRLQTKIRLFRRRFYHHNLCPNTHSHPLFCHSLKPAVSAANMEPVAGDRCVIETISFWQSFRIYALSCVFGAWVLFWRMLRCLWDPNGYCRLQTRDNPPACLVDTTLGQHKYVKLKVGFFITRWILFFVCVCVFCGAGYRWICEAVNCAKG